MTTTNKVSSIVGKQLPQFVEDNNPLFGKFLEYYYKSQEKTGYGQNILNDFLRYMNIDELNVNILSGGTKIVESMDSTDTEIVVENVDKFLEKNGSILIDDEVIFYENAISSPSIALSPGISYNQVKIKWTILQNLVNDFDGTTKIFQLLSQQSPVIANTPQHLIVEIYGKVLIPGVDYTVDSSNIVFTEAPRVKTTSDDSGNTSITFLEGFSENDILVLDDVSTLFGDNRTTFDISRNQLPYQPVIDEYIIAIYDGQILTPKVDFTFDLTTITFNFIPLIGRQLSLFSIEAPIPSFGSGGVGFARVNDAGELSSIVIDQTGSNYRSEFPPKVSIKSKTGSNASAIPLINGIKNIQLLSSGKGYSQTNPPTVVIGSPTKTDGTVAKIQATVDENGNVSELNVTDSGNGYTFVPRVVFRQPGGAKLSAPNMANGSISGSITVADPGQGYTTAPVVYVDQPTGNNPITASLRAVLNSSGEVSEIEVLNAGQGYIVTPRIAIVDPVGAQVLETKVDSDGRVVDIELLSGGSGYDDVPSVYVVDDRINDVNIAIGGTGARAVAAIFNGQITDINITNFGSGYSQSNPPKIVIQSPPNATASVEIGLGEVTGFEVINKGKGYSKCKFTGCARAASGITGYTTAGEVQFSGETQSASHDVDASIKCLDALFVKRLLDKYTEQYLPDIPSLDYENIDVRTAIKNIKTFYSAKGTSFGIAYLFKLLYGEDVSISYPKDQIIKPSSATWSVNTILRATLASGDPTKIKDALVQQFADIADTNVRDASALVENYISIKTSEVEIFELVLSEETITGQFVVPYKTRLVEGLSETSDVITVDSTIGWPERNGEFIIAGQEVIRYKEKSLNQFIECTRGANGTTAASWDAASEIKSNFQIFLNQNTLDEVVMNIVGIVDAQQTTLSDTGSYYLPGDKLTVSKLGGTTESPQLTNWLYNVKKLIEIQTITFGGLNDQSATVTCNAPHGLLVGDQVTVYGANPIIYNGTFEVSSRDSTTVFQYRLPQPASVNPQGNILISVDLNKGKSTDTAIESIISLYTTNVQNAFFNNEYVYVASTGIPNYNIGPFSGSALLPGNQRKLNRFPALTQTISTKVDIIPGPIGTWINGVSAWSYKSTDKKTFGALTSINITNTGRNYDAERPPAITVSGGGGTGAEAEVVVDGSLTEIEVTSPGSGYTSSPLVSIVGGGGSGASATAIVTKGIVSRILVNNGGQGYISKPSITIVGGKGTGAQGNASVRGPVKSVTIINGGSSYIQKPDITLSSGVGAVAQAIVSNGRIISIAIISGGIGYTTAPEVTVSGDGFGAVAKANIDLDGENAGKVTSIEILNRGIGYTQGLTQIGLTSVGADATFDAQVFEWTYNVETISNKDSAKGFIFEGINNQYGGEYAHVSNPQRLRYILGDNLILNEQDIIVEQETQLEHSPIIGYAFDGNPIYGPYSYEDPTDQTTSLIRMRSSYALKSNLVFNAISNPTPSRVDGPLLVDDVAGSFIEDFQYNFGTGDLDQYNGRFCKTPDFPNGRYCYFVTIDGTESGNPVFPYILGPNYNSIVDMWNLSTSAIQQNIPTGVVRYRDPYENVDIDITRIPNASSNSLTTEDGLILLLDPEDENRDGIIDQEEIDDPEQLFEEAPLQLYDYFPKVKFDSKVDIEVETIEKFEDASVSGFIVENPGKNYQVNDILVFDNTNTDGLGISARISKIQGESVSSYVYETVEDVSYGILTTGLPHNIVAGDQIFVDYSPIMDNTNKTYIARQYKGVEEIVVTQNGSGYNVDIPPTITIDGDGENAIIEAELTSVGSISKFNVINSGHGFTNNPRIISSHPQVFKKANYYTSLISNNEFVKINDIFVTETKQVYICGKTLDNQGDTVGFISKISALGAKEWEKTFESNAPAGATTYMEFERLLIDGSDIYVVGNNRPNQAILDSYNPDIVLVKYIESVDGLDATLAFQKSYSGISGSSRADNVTSLIKLSADRFVIGGFTNTNSANPHDAFVAILDTAGTFVIKRKFATNNDSEKILDLIERSGKLYLLMEISDTLADGDKSLIFGECSVSTSLITTNYLKKLDNTVYSFIDATFVIDEYNEFYISSTLRLKSDDSSRDSIWVGKFDLLGDLIWNYRYAAPSREVTLVNRSAIDIFGNLNLAYTENNITSGQLTASSLKINYKGEIVNHTTNKFASSTSTSNNIEGISANALAVDNSGDVYIFGQTSWNTNEFVLEFATDFTDKTQHYTPTVVGNDTTQALVTSGDGIAKFFAKDVASPSNWENAYIKFVGSDLANTFANDWTLEFMIYKDATNSDTHSQTQHTLVAIGDATDSTGGLWLYYDDSSGRLSLVVSNNQNTINSSVSALQSTQTTLYANDSWQFVSLTRSNDNFTMYVNGTQLATGSILNTSLGAKDLYIGNIPGRDGTTGNFRSNEQGQFYLDNLRLRNKAVTPTVPSDVTGLPPTVGFALAYDWIDDPWFNNHTARYAYIDYVGFGVKVDKNADAVRTGSIGVQTNTQVLYERANVTPVSGNSLTVVVTAFDLGASGLQSLDYNESTTTHTNAAGASTIATDLWSSRNATIPAPGSQKVQASAIVKNRYFFKEANTIKIDNVQRLTLNQQFNITVGSKLVLNNGSTFVNSGYVTSVDNTNNYVFVAINNNEWSNDLNVGELSTERFDEQSTYGVRGPVVTDVNEIKNYQFLDVVASTPGTFNIDLSNYDAPSIIGGSNNLDDFGKFKDYGPSVFSIKIGETSGVTTYIPGSVIEVPTENITFNAAKSTIQITGLTGVTKITLTTSLNKILKVSAVDNSDTVYVITNNSHYLSQGNVVYIDGNPTNEYNGSFTIDSVISVKEFTYKLATIATTLPASTPGLVSIFAKSPILKMYYGHQYIFDVSHSTMLNSNLSFSKDSLNKLEYSFNTIDRIGTSGVSGEGQPSPSIKFKLDKSIVTNISYYFDPSRLGDDSPVSPDSFLDIVDSPYIGNFTIQSTSGGTITSGDDEIRFALPSEPEGNGETINTSYTTSSEKAVGSIGDIRIVNSGGFYTKLPTVDRIDSNRKIERVQINEPGTEYAVGVYLSVPIQGDGEGGFVQITVENTTDGEGIVTPGQITEVKVTSPGKSYTTASIDIQAVEGILGSGLNGSGADLVVVIPPFGSGASIFTKGTNIGKIKKLTNNNFGYDYPHDYTLRPEITFPINAQLINTSILQSITITNPGSGYTQAPVVSLTGGGGSNAIAEASIKNGRLDTIIVKDPGAGYSTEPNVELKSSFNYVVNLDLGLLQFAFPHGIENGSEISLNVVDIGDGISYPVASGAIGTLNNINTYYAVTGSANSLDSDQMKIAITKTNADLGDAITFVNAGVGRQQVLTSSFGGAATANVGTSVFLEGEFIYQGDTIDNATATGYVSSNNGWQVGSRIIKIVDYDGEFNLGQKITGTISKSSGIIGDLKIAKGVLEIGPITKTTGQFVDDTGKPSEIIQRIQDSYFYQDFSYAINSSVSIEEWKNTVIKNVHPASFKVFGQLEIQDNASIPNKETFFELTKSVELTRDAVVPNVQSFALAEPIYQDFNNTEVLFRQKRLTSSENILTSVVQRLDDISGLFDGLRTQFPITVEGENVIANSNQLMIVLNGVVQTPEDAFQVLNDSIVFVEPPQPVASVKYVSVGIEQIPTKLFTFSNFTGIFPPIGNYIVGVATSARARVVGSAGNTVTAYVTEGTFAEGELVTSNATGFTANLLTLNNISNIGLFRYGETIRNIDGDTAKVERINLASGQESPLAQLRFNIGVNTTTFDVVSVDSYGVESAVAAGVFEVNNQYQIASEIFTVTAVTQNTGFTNLVVTRAQLGTTSIGHLASTPIYGTDIEVTSSLLLSKLTGTYQSTPGLFDIQLNDIVIAAGSGVVARITSTSPYQDPVTQQFVDSVTISEGSSFSGLLFNRITSQTYPNIILDNLSQSQVNIVSFDNYESNTAFNSKFPANEIINNYIIKYISATGGFTEGETVRNYKIDYANVYGQFAQGDLASVRKLSLSGEVGDGFFSRGQIIRSENTKAEILGYNRATDTIYLGKMGRSQSSGEDYHNITFAAGTEINSYNEKFGTGCLALSPGTSTHTFVSGVADAITAGSGASGQFTAATGTTYDPISGLMVIEIGSHSLTTSNTITIADSGVVFTCAQDGNASNKAYPRATDPASGSNLAISAVTSTKITVNVGVVPIDEYASVATSTEFGFGTTDFTVECWIKPNSIATGGKTIFDFRTAATELSPYVYLDGAVVKYYVNGADVIAGTTSLVAGTWYHVAVCKSTGTTKLFLNGVQQGSDYTDSNNYGSTKPIRIGAAWNASNVFPGYVDEFRVSTSARYAAAFTTPTGINQGDTNTVLLLHFDGVDGQVYTEDWSGEQNWTNGHEFNNDAILATSRANASSPGGFVGKSHRYLDSGNLLQSNKEFLAEEIRYLVDPNLATQLTTTAPQYVLNAPDYNAGDLFSYSVAHGNGKFVIGAQGDDNLPSGVYDNGSVYVYSEDGVYERTITPSDPAAFDRFGWSVAIGGNKIGVGAPYNDITTDAQGSVYIYDLDGSNEVTIIPSDVATKLGAWFGYSIAIGSSKIVVGAPTTDATTTNSGTVYVYNLDGTGEVIIEPSDGAADDNFGYSVAIDEQNNKIIVGAYLDDDNGSASGSVYVYNLDGTGQVKIDPTDGAADDYFGTSVAAYDNLIVIGANGNGAGGSAYLYQNNGTFVAKIVASDTATDDNFGVKVAVNSQSVFVAASGGDERGISSTGVIYKYDRVGQNEVKLIESSTAAYSTLGNSSLFANDNYVMASSKDSVVGQSESGRAYIWKYNTIAGSDSSVAGNYDYAQEVRNAIDNLTDDLNNGSNNHMWDFAATSVNRDANPITTTRFSGEENLQLQTYQYVNTYAQNIISNVLVNVTGSHGLTQTTDATITDSTYPAGVHTFVSGVTNAITAGGGASGNFTAASGTTYNPTTGVMVIEIGSHSLTTSNTVTIADGGVVFTCDADNNTLQTAYPRATDPASGTALTILAETATTITVNVGVAVKLFTPTGATYAPSTGLLVITIGSHSLTTSDRISIATGGITFTCTQDSGATNHAYPRATDPAANAVLPIAATTGTTITVNVGASPTDQQYAHTYVSSTSNAITVLNYTSADCADVKTTIDNLVSILEDTISNATAGTPVDHLGTITKVTPAYEYLGGVVGAFIEVPIEVSLNDSANTLLYTNQIDTDAKSRFKDAANLIRLNRGAIVDKAAFDLLARYPDLGQDMPRNDGGSNDGTLRCKTDMGLILDSLAQDLEDGGNKNVIRAGRFYLGVNDVLLHIRLQVWQSVFAHQRLAIYTKQAITGDLTDDNTDNVIIGDWGITNDAVVNFTPTGATYDPVTGVMILTIGSHSLALGRRITIVDNSLTFTCSQDGNTNNKTYPRSTDPASGVSLEIVASTATTIAVNVGASPEVTFTPTTGTTYDPSTGLMVLEIGAHSLTAGTSVKLAPNSLTFSCGFGGATGSAAEKTYPRSNGNDPFYNTAINIESVTATTITLQVLTTVPSTNTDPHTFVSATSGAVITGGDYTHTFVSASSNSVSTAGDCANVKDAIDTLLENINDIISPEGNDYQIAADRLYFNRDYMTFETIGRTKNEYSYNLGGSTFNSYSFVGDNIETNVRADLEFILISIISDLQTGGNNSALDSIAEYVTSTLRVTKIETILGQFVELLTQLKFLGSKAIQNYLYSISESPSGAGEYQAQYNTIAAYRDSESPTSIGDVVTRFESLIDSVIGIFTPSKDAGISASKQMLFNEAYYKNEISSVVTAQFGAGSWTFEQFIDDIVTDIEHDIITTDTSSSNTAQGRKITLQREGVLDVINFTSGAGYTSVPTVTIAAPPAGGIQATANAVLSPNAVLTSIQIDAAGSGYTANGKYTYSGAPFVGTHGGYLTQTSGGITSVSYDGEVVDFNNSGNFTFGTGAAILNSGAGTTTADGFNVGYQHAKFGAGTASYPQRSVVVNKVFNPVSAGYDKVRVYVIAGNGSNGGNAPNDTEDLGLYVSINNGPFNYKDRLVYGGSTGGAKNASNFTTLNFVDLDLTTTEKEASYLKFEIRQMAHGTSSTSDHYGVTRISCYNSNQAGFNLINNGITVTFGQADTQSGTPTTPTLTFLSSRFVDQIQLISRGSGYLPATPPTATFSGGNPTTPATVTNITVVLDSSRFTPGQILISDQGASAEVYEDIGDAIYVGPITGTAFAAGQLLTQGSVSAEIASGGVGSPFDWYGSVGNVQTFNTIRSIASLVEDETSSVNLLTNSETYSTINWSILGMDAPANNSDISPDGTSTAITFTPSSATGPKGISRQISLTAYNTFDDSALKFDSGSQSFDNGPNDIDARQQFTVSYFVKANGYSTIRHYLRVVPLTAYAFIQVDLTTGTVEQTFEVGATGVLELNSSGAIPYGNGWYRVYLTGTFGYGFTNIISEIQLLDSNGAPNITGDGSSGLFVWGSKFNANGLDAYTAVSNQVFFSNIEYNIKKFALELFEGYTELALNNQLPNPAPNSGSIPFYNSAFALDYNTDSIQRIIRENVKTLQSQLLDTDHYLNVDLVGNVTIPTKTFGERSIPIPLGGGIRGSDYLYGSLSDASSEVQKVTVNEGIVVKDYKRFRIDGEIQNGPFLMNETVQKQGDATVQGVIYGFHQDANYKYLDVAVTGGTWALADIIVGATNGTTAAINAVENRLHVIDVRGGFQVNSVFRGYTSNSTAATEIFLQNESAVLDNTGGKLVVDTETLNGSFETTSVVYPEESRVYIEVQKYAGFDIGVGDRIVANGYSRLGLSIQNNKSGFVAGNFIYKLTGGVADANNYGIINKVDLDNNYIYVVPVVGGFQNGDTVVHYDISNILTGQGIVNTTLNVEGQAAGKVQFIEDAGLNKRLYISDTIGTIADTDSIKGGNGYRSAVLSKVVLRARVNRFFRGFDGTQTTFDLSINNGDAYLPDPAGHMLIFINGILQPPGSSNAFTAFSDKIQFSEPPTLGSSFTGFYVGKLRQLDDISFEFDSLRQSFNLRRNDVFYSLTLTDGVQSSTIRPENNIIVSLNGVVQEPGVGFEIVGSRIIFNEIPRVGSTFVAFSYVGSEADVDAAEVIPPVEPGDLLEIQGEVSDREVAVIESSNSLVTFDYLGSVFGKDASASTTITKGTIQNVSVTSPGSGYSSRPTVRIDSISGFDAQVKALVGVGNIAVNTGGSGYQPAVINVETTVPDDWTSPDISQYGEEAIDPEIV